MIYAMLISYIPFVIWAAKEAYKDMNDDKTH